MGRIQLLSFHLGCQGACEVVPTSFNSPTSYRLSLLCIDQTIIKNNDVCDDHRHEAGQKTHKTVWNTVKISPLSSLSRLVLHTEIHVGLHGGLISTAGARLSSLLPHLSRISRLRQHPAIAPSHPRHQPLNLMFAHDSANFRGTSL